MNGESISQLLSSHLEHPKEGMIIPHDWPYFQSQEDAELLELHEENKNKWKKISEKATFGRDKNMIKHRIHFLEQYKHNEERMHRAIIPGIADLDEQMDEDMAAQL
jgi:hypothetical protein